MFISKKNVCQVLVLILSTGSALAQNSNSVAARRKMFEGVPLMGMNAAQGNQGGSIYPSTEGTVDQELDSLGNMLGDQSSNISSFYPDYPRSDFATTEQAIQVLDNLGRTGAPPPPRPKTAAPEDRPTFNTIPQSPRNNIANKRLSGEQRREQYAASNSPVRNGQINSGLLKGLELFFNELYYEMFAKDKYKIDAVVAKIQQSMYKHRKLPIHEVLLNGCEDLYKIINDMKALIDPALKEIEELLGKGQASDIGPKVLSKVVKDNYLLLSKNIRQNIANIESELSRISTIP